MAERYHGKTRYDQLRTALDVLEHRGCATLHLEIEGGDHLSLEFTEPGHVWNWIDSKGTGDFKYRVHEDTHIAREVLTKLGIPLGEVSGLKGLKSAPHSGPRRRVVRGNP